MNDKLLIIVGLVVALVVLTLPFWYAVAAWRSDSSPSTPQYELPDGNCVRDDMKAQHMDLLNQWREAVVRNGQGMYYSENLGEEVKMSLTETCLLQCHDVAADSAAASVGAGDAMTVRGAFCQKCHSYADVQPTCWGCHLECEEK